MWYFLQGQLVYANYGEKRDFDLLKERGVECKDSIIIMRYGNIYRGEKVIFNNKLFLSDKNT